MSGLGSERDSVQDPLIRYAREVGWTYLPPSEALRLRRGETGFVLFEETVRQLQRLNPGVVDHLRAEEVITRLTRIPPNIEGNLQAWEYLKGLKTVFVDTERRERNVRLMDAEEPGRNTFHVTDEWTFTNGTHGVRADVVFLVNGVPVLLVETKSAKRREGIAEALEQVRRYHRQAPELMALLQLHALTHLVHFHYGATWNLTRKALFNWRDEQTTGDFETLVKTFLHPVRVVRVLSDYILFTRRDEELTKVVLRPHQMRAVERVIQRAHDPAKRRALVWHTQGSGKTYTMITVARELIRDPRLENPTVLMLVDRNELEAQLLGNLESVGLRNAEVATSKHRLRELLASDRRGLIVSMIHKFQEIPARINERRNVIVLVDEAHRTTGGDLGNYLMGALPHATYIGFTGTPIDRTAHGRGTFKVFGQDDARGYLDRYSIRESVQDGTTVPLHYALAPNDLQVDQETLNREFLDLAELEGVSDPEELDRVLERAVTLKNMLKAPQRVEQVAAFVARHFRETVEPMGYKAFLVGVDREACVLYKEALDRHLPGDYSAVVISHGHNDPEHLERHRLGEDAERELRKRFREPDGLPKILIVTEKLLTGFDAPILYCMYLDKPMRDHVLLQAIARVNRPYEDTTGRRKPAGFVVDFVGIFARLERALAFDSEDVQGVVQGVDVLQRRFATLVAQGREQYLQSVLGRSQDKATEEVLLRFRDREERHGFYRAFRELEELYDILSPDPYLRPYLEDYTALTQIYHLLRAAYEPGVQVDRGFLYKTRELVRRHTRTSVVRAPRTTYEVSAEAIARLADDDEPDTVKVFNLVKALRELVEQKGTGSPYLIPIGERAEEIARAFEDGQLTTQGALEQALNLTDEYQEAERERTGRNLSPEAFAVYWFLRREGIGKAEDAAREASALFDRYPHWQQSAQQEREVRKHLYRVLLDAGVEPIVAFGDKILRMLRGSA
ncbi:MAG TPA: HsdR family type I site-specific deoxyribonuclease [Longimicrobiaceae bacterium]|nr:HsdR family type I site-specific deoxyribonuclease [Longimicrobiaceae bacterium]